MPASLATLVKVSQAGHHGTDHQEREYPARIIGTQMRNPDFALYARAFGAYGERVELTEEFAPAFERALASGKSALLHCLLDLRAISVGKDFVLSKA
ncbi:hypothetical protein FXV83_39735 [Bradyrhizobium hipponense]|uniref:Thiamine pyrophosphate enzyme TPP-binding domain-containing protein n=1 Tax=Bradyrhizobium hipponense TaxID=2605638 RepID=A0A5S4YCD1_9BRAD|nr:hypothetical protein FXV83_39735 [Bradyrhizobium hipponense]